MTPHALEVAYLIASSVAVGASSVMFSLKIWDLLRVKKAKQNGPLLYATSDNLRRQGFTMAVAAAMLMAAVSAVNNTEAVTPQIRNLLTCLLFVAIAITTESTFIYRRRERLAELIAMYEVRPGGRRSTDPPAE